MTVKDREHKRFIRRLPVWCESGGIKLKGFTVDLSSGGLAIWGKKGFKPKSMVDVFVPTEFGEIKLKGEIRWCRQEAKRETLTFVFLMGVQILERSQAYIQFLEGVITETESKSCRGGFKERLTVTYESQVRFWEEYERNLKHRGIFLPTADKFSLREVIPFSVHLLGPMVVLHAEGAVVYVIDEHIAREKGIERGVGVQISRFYYDDEALFEELIASERAKRDR
ncbi:MAG: PilZ domain-containing protein [Myxococcota bacterium]|nr:PilZ domain-containing protein [Myxococcota bacterium]